MQACHKYGVKAGKGKASNSNGNVAGQGGWPVWQAMQGTRGIMPAARAKLSASHTRHVR